MIVSEQLNYTKTRRFHAIFMPVIIEFSRCIGTYSSAKFEFFIHTFIRWVWLKEVTYSFRYAGLILLFLVITTVALSMIIEKAKEIIRYHEVVRWLQNKVQKCVVEL